MPLGIISELYLLFTDLTHINMMALSISGENNIPTVHSILKICITDLLFLF